MTVDKFMGWDVDRVEKIMEAVHPVFDLPEFQQWLRRLEVERAEASAAKLRAQYEQDFGEELK
jgi:hypothetical protein